MTFSFIFAYENCYMRGMESDQFLLKAGEHGSKMTNYLLLLIELSVHKALKGFLFLVTADL